MGITNQIILVYHALILCAALATQVEETAVAAWIMQIGMMVAVIAIMATTKKAGAVPDVLI
jgi:pheromone shutdown protein TraB